MGIRKELMFWDKSTKGKQTINQTKKNHKNMGSWEKRRGKPTVEMGEG